MRVGILAFLHESNTFISRPTQRRHFEENLLLCGEPIRGQLAETHHEIGGFFEGLKEEQIEAVPLVAARAVPFGPIEAACFDTIVNLICDQLEQAGRLDGVLAAPHGATVAEHEPDADGYWLTKVREQMGVHAPLIATLDAHANLSQRLVAATDALIAYRSNPHLDQRARGIEAARLMAATLRGDVRPTQAAAFPPVAINIERQLTSDGHCRPFYALADEMLNRPQVLSNSILLGFPYADVPQMGSSVVAVTDNNPSLARELALELADYLWQHRQEFAGQLAGIPEVIQTLQQKPGDEWGPVCLLDMGDNVGGGSPADGTLLPRALLAADLGPGFACLYDPEAVQQAEAAGVGSTLELTVGGKTDKLHGAPIESTFEVVGLYTGKFEEPEPRHGGFTQCDQGPTAVIRETSGKLDLMVTTKRMPPFSLRQLTSCGLDPGKYRVLVAKGVNAPVAAYAPVCSELIRVNSPGCTTADMNSLTFHHRRRPMFPFEAATEWNPVAE